MARDLDFRTKPRVVGRAQQSQPIVKTDSVADKRTSNRWLWIVLTALLILAGVGIWQLLVSTAPSPSRSIKPTTAQTPVAITPDGANGNGSLVSPQTAATAAPLVQVYDSGAGATITDSLVDKLKTLGYKVENLKKSQFDYDRTYIRYRAGMQSVAEKIQSALPDRLVSLKEVQTAGLFDILILYGQK